jgi:hypothetical protein
MIDAEFALQEKFLDVTIAQRILKIPSYPIHDALRSTRAPLAEEGCAHRRSLGV